MVYYRDGILSHTIPSNVSQTKRKIIVYLKKHTTAGEEELVKQLKLPCELIQLALKKMEQSGRIESVA